MNIKRYLYQPIRIAPLATFRVVFGLLMCFSIIRFWNNGWIETLYLTPEFHFHYSGFQWVKPLGIYTYLLFSICGLSALLIAAGYKYRLAIILFFLSFTYIELMDKTTYLNHYYFVSVVSFLMIFLPANAYASVDAALNKNKTFSHVPRWTILSVKVLLSMVYFYAGLAKLNSDWLVHAAPLKIWLSTKSHLPLIGAWMTQEWFHYAVSWLGALYDLSIPLLLFTKRTRLFAFALVVVFHILTWVLFPIGMFPFIMIGSTLIFFSAEFHQKILNWIFSLFGKKPTIRLRSFPNSKRYKLISLVVGLFIIIQLAFPFRYLLYPGELFWTEQGFRFSWRVMLMEKAGAISFTIIDKNSGKTTHVEPSEYLTRFQEKQMSFQPDFILQFAHFLAEEYKKKGYEEPAVYADCYVALNGRRSQRYINPKIDLTKVHEEQNVLDWLMPFDDEIKGL